MSDGKSVKITIDATGKAKVDALNFQGVGCESATRAFQEVFAGKTTGENYKPEYYETESTGQTLDQRM